MFADYHVHTCYSDDSEYLMEDVVRDAISFGMNEICFTDHVDYGIKRDWDDPLGVIYRKGGPGEPERMPVANPIPLTLSSFPCTRWKIKNSGPRISSAAARRRNTICDIMKRYWHWSGNITTTVFWDIWT